MAKTELKSSLQLDFTITLTLTITEARALNAIVKYGSKSFLEGYYKQLGKSYLEPYERGVESLFETVKEKLPFKLSNVNRMVEAIENIKGLNK